MSAQPCRCCPPAIGFGRVAGYEPPRWPDPFSTKRYHPDLYVDDLDKAAAVPGTPARPRRTSSQAANGGAS